MKRIGIWLCMILLICACGRQAAVLQTESPQSMQDAATEGESFAAASPLADASNRSIREIAAPTVAQTAAPTSDPFADRFSEVPVRSERSYKSKGLSVTVQSYSVDETYGRHVTYHVADLYVRDVKSIKARAAQDDFCTHYTRPVKEIAADAGALLAIAGDSYTREQNCFVIRNGVLYRDTPIDNADLCVLYRNGVMETKQWGTFDPQEIIDAEPWQVWDFGPALLDENGKALMIEHRLQGHNPRTAIGYYEPGHYCFVVVDGRGESVGVTLSSLSRLMEDLGCKAAYNLDGGDSAQLWWNGEIVSAASNTSRVIGDIIYLLPEGEA